MAQIRFVWDDRKARINFAKHRISFEEATTVFLDELAIQFFDPEHSEDEDRFLMLGLSVHSRILVVCHCYRENKETVRIISARKGTRKEREFYQRRGKS